MRTEVNGRGRRLRKVPMKRARGLTPLYHQVYLALRQRIQCGDLDASLPMPGEHQLAAQFGVSRVTVRRTLRQLEDERLVRRQHGVGTFPLPQPERMQDRYNAGGLTEAGTVDGMDARITTLAAGRVVPPPRVAGLLGSGTEPVLRILRQRAVGGSGPFTLLTTWVPARHAARLGRRELRSALTLVALEEAGVEITRAEQGVTAQAADEEHARLLGVPVGAPLLAMTTLFTDAQDGAVALFEALYRPDRYEYRTTMIRRGSGRQRRWQVVD